MSGPSTVSLIAAAVFALVPFAAQAQEQGRPAALPQGAGKETVEAVCTQCHQTNMITGSSGYTRDGWKELVGTMIDLSPNPEWRDSITEYLAANFPPNTRRAPKLISGPAEISFTEWQMPTLGQRSRDPIQADDGSIWWAGQFGNLIGRLDPATGEMKEYKLPPNAMPHSVWLDDKGIPWYTGNKNGTVGKVDPATGKVTEYKMPDPAAKDPHTAVFDKKGILWFTLQNSNMVGRLDPATGDIKLVTMKHAGFEAVRHQDRRRGRALVRVQRPPLPGQDRPGDDGAHRSRAAVRGHDGPASRHRRRRHDLVRELGPRPARALQSEDRRDQGVAVAQRAEVASLRHRGRRRHRLVQRVRPAARMPLVRFDPSTETFQSWAIPSGGIYAGIIRHMRATREGNLLIHQSSTNRIILVTVKRRAASR